MIDYKNLEKYSSKQYLCAKSRIGMNDLKISRSWFSKLISRENQTFNENLNDKRNNHKASLHILNKLMNANVII